MSPPSPAWHIVGGANYRSVARPPVNPRRAIQEWLALADAIDAAGAEIVVLSPPPPPRLLSGLMYTANAGWLAAADRFRVANLSVAHRKGEQPYLLEALPELLGVSAESGAAVWEGQADMCTLSPGAILLSYGVRSAFESLAEVRALLPPAVRTQAAQLREPFFHGDTCMDVVETRSGRAWLVFPGAFASREEYLAVRAFAEREAEVLEIGEADALAYACNSLSIGRTLLAPDGLSDALTARLAGRGIDLQPLSFEELFGKGGGGPRCLVNELSGIAARASGAGYRQKRPELLRSVDSYPDSAA
jgi:N-dimethylarginine dimethylaminohydrolase